jgi:hypothetical protein
VARVSRRSNGRAAIRMNLHHLALLANRVFHLYDHYRDADPVLFDSVSLKIPNVCAYERDKIACTFQFVEWCFNRLGERRRAHNIANVLFFRRALHCCVVCMRSGSTSKLVSGSPFTNRRHRRRPSDRPGRSPSRLQVSTFPARRVQIQPPRTPVRSGRAAKKSR